MNHSKYLNILKGLFYAGIEAVEPTSLIHNYLSLEKNILILKTEKDYKLFNLDTFDEIYVIGAGKASECMAEGIYEILGDSIKSGLVVTKEAKYFNIGMIHVMEAGHPFPDERSVNCGTTLQVMAHRAKEKTLFISLISGGASALVEVPRVDFADGEEVKLSLDDIVKVNKLLLHCGASIEEINCVRKHVSMIKGGYLSAWMYPATALNLILSDDELDRIDVIGSGLTTYDETFFEDVLWIIEKYDIKEKMPEKVMKIFKWGVNDKILETPKSEKLVFDKTTNVIIGNNAKVLNALKNRAIELGFKPIVRDTWIKGESRAAGRELYGEALKIKYDKTRKKPVILISGGETTVNVQGRGKGGRNQEMALAFLEEIERNPGDSQGIHFLSASTDGNDGPTDATGAFASSEIAQTAKLKGISISEYLSRNDSYTFFDSCGYLFKTGYTGTNVCDVQIVLIK